MNTKSDGFSLVVGALFSCKKGGDIWVGREGEG